jgi:hypothetical protein
MAAPLSRFGQITQAETLINDNTNQDISALDVRNTLSGIIDSTTGMKTIWVGNIVSSFLLQVEQNGFGDRYFSSGQRTEVRVVEAYSDPYFFPPISPKYIITDAGSGIQGSATQKNVTTSLKLPPGAFPPGAFYKFGGGLTFDCTVNTTSLTLSSISVANPGSGYSSLLLTSSDPGWGIVELNFPLAVVKPIVKIQLDTVVAAKTGDPNSISTGSTAMFDNVFCFNSPNMGTALYQPNVGGTSLEAIYVTSKDTATTFTGRGYTSALGQYLNANNAIGFNLNIKNYFDASNFSTGSQDVRSSMQVEIKVPIINTTF